MSEFQKSQNEIDSFTKIDWPLVMSATVVILGCIGLIIRWMH